MDLAATLCGTIFILQASSIQSCSIPAGYNPIGASGKHYYKVHDSIVSKGSGNGLCQGDHEDAHLPFFKTQEEYDNIKEIFGMTSSNIWLGLSNPDSLICLSTQECSGKLLWTDGSVFEAQTWMAVDDVRADDNNVAKRCFKTALDGNRVANDRNCDLNHYIACQLDDPCSDTESPVVSSWNLAVALETCGKACNRECGNWRTNFCYGHPLHDETDNTTCKCYRSSIVRNPGLNCGPRGFPCSNDHGSEQNIQTWVDGQNTFILGYQGEFPETSTGTI